ncbi:MAG: Asp23/Gls24 family envelope stress response protein [Peptostreptococcaceae bacterium]|nr:Asp23/Gls24 family envelope stress response protein [Peptostreptococcaceae bacterium]
MNNKDFGQVKISEDVIATIASLATCEVEGVSQMLGSFTGNLSEILGKKNFSKGVKVQVTDNQVDIDAHVYIEYGSIIPKISEKIQENVKNTVENMTGLKVSSVNVHVQGIVTKQEKSQEQR